MTDDLIQPYLNTPLHIGWNPLVENDPEVNITLGIYRIAKGDSHSFVSERDEIALMLMEGKGTLEWEGKSESFQRHSLIEDNPLTVHVAKETPVTIRAESECEFAFISTENPDSFTSQLYTPDAMLEIDHRGKGILDDACYRIVRTIFDRRNAPEQARLVLGEVVNYPGRWSSYPPHHHTQPELYYYRFIPDWGYGHGELGDQVVKLRHHDVLRITGERDHAQVSAPGFHMYYLWTIRHLPGDPYLGFEYTPPFESLLD